MDQRIHTLIVGEQGVGKSTLIHKILEELKLSVCGFETKKEDGLAEETLGSPIYIYEAGLPHIQASDNLVGHCKDQRPVVYPEGFDRFADKLYHLPKDKDVILLDEVGIMESRSEAFCKAILDTLDGDRPIIAAVKYKDRPFLNQVRSHPKCRCFNITPENREEVYVEALWFVRNVITEK